MVTILGMVTVLGMWTVQWIVSIPVMVGAADWIPYSLRSFTDIHIQNKTNSRNC